jgi:protein-L-isoaspartate O-methyltransferase
MSYTATYSPEDNKLRLYSTSRLDKELYDRVRSAGFIFAPKQDLFVAPMWTPSREDLLIELAGEIEDEDRSLVDRAEERADRFSDYKESRIEDAQTAQNAVDRIADNIPLGQPILVGHHSERHARKDAERIQNGMRKTVQMWQTARYWEQRAAGALHHAKYKALPGVRHRRIKGLEADKRKQERNKQEAEMWLKLWTDCANEQDKDLQAKVALRLAGMCHLTMPRKEGDREDFQHNPSAYDALTGNHTTLYAPRTLDEVLSVALETYPRIVPSYDRWIDHYTNRIAYEKAMLGESGGLAADRFSFEVGGKVLVGGEWLVILKINKTGNSISSLTTTPRRHFYGSKNKAEIESVKDYQAPKPEETAAVKAATKLPPMCNYPGEGFKHMTTDEWKRKKMSDVPQSATHPETETHGAHRTRSTWGGNWTTVSVYLTDAKQIDPPTKAPVTPENTADALKLMASELKALNPLPAPHAPRQRDERIPSHEELHEMEKTNVVVISAPQLFPTPPSLADRMVELANIQPGQRVLEPSAGTGRIIDAIRRKAHGYAITAVELNCNLAHRLRMVDCVDDTHQADFLECNGNLGQFERILMNPPFANADDIKHITHALTMLKPGGRLVAICANGPRQQDKLRPIVEDMRGTWEELPPDTFTSAGTSVRTVLLAVTTTA